MERCTHFRDNCILIKRISNIANVSLVQGCPFEEVPLYTGKPTFRSATLGKVSRFPSVTLKLSKSTRFNLREVIL